MKKIITLLLGVVLIFTLVGCMDLATNDVNETEEDEVVVTAYSPVDVTTLTDDNRPVVTIEMNDGNKIVMKLVPEVAPNTVNNFISLINQNFYDGLTFHRVWSGFMIQGGDPEGDGTGGPGYEIEDEFFAVEEATGYYLSHVRGVLSMAKTQFPDSAGSQFFIMHADSTDLDLNYSAFGLVTEGMDVVDEIANVETGKRNKPVEDVIIESIKVELNGYEYEEPTKVE